MKKFIQYVLGICAILLVLLFALDLLYTNVYAKSNPRSKTQYILSLKPQKIDYVFLGSSRVSDHIVTKDVESRTGKKAINLGIEGAWLNDNLLQLKLLLDRKVRIEKLFLQLDYQFENDNDSPITRAEALPFIHNATIAGHLKNEDQFYALYYIPFYRYMTADFSIGFRTFFFSLIGKKTTVDLADGFVPKPEGKNFKREFLPKAISKKNAALDQITDLCRKNNIELILYCAPFCSKIENRDYVGKLKNKFPQLQVYDKGFDDSMFMDCGHLGERGAKLLTRQIIDANLIALK